LQGENFDAEVEPKPDSMKSSVSAFYEMLRETEEIHVNNRQR